MDYWKLVADKEESQRTERLEENNNKIQPSNVPLTLPTMTDDDIARKEVTVTPLEIVPEILKRKVVPRESVDKEERQDSTEVDESSEQLRRGDGSNQRDEQSMEEGGTESSGESDQEEMVEGEEEVLNESEEDEKRGWKRQRKDLEEPTREVVVRDMFNVPTDEEEEEDQQKTRKNWKPLCPVPGCEWRTLKIREHVNRMHLPRVMWDNPNPPVRQSRYDQLNRIRWKVLLFLCHKIVGTHSLFDLLAWCEERVDTLIPRRAVMLGRQIEQMRSLTTTMKCQRPVYNRYTVYPPNHTSVLIQWRYQVALLKHLTPEDRKTYMDFGTHFMTDPHNLELPVGKKGPKKTLLTRTILNPGPVQPEWDEAQSEDAQGRVTLDQCGEVEEQDSDSEDERPTDAVRKVVHVGQQQYTLVLRGKTLDISGNFHRSTSHEEAKEPCTPDPVIEAWDAFDTHLHLDRTSKRLLGNLALTMDGWTEESMERPPTVPINLVGGTLIYCDPESYPATVPIDDKWRIAVGVHPKRVRNLSQREYDHFKSLIQSKRVTAVGEIGLDRTVPKKDWADQTLFLEAIVPTLREEGKPIILHVRSHQDDKFSALLYLLLLKIFEDKFPTTQPFILHCFTGTYEISKAWLNHFPNTYFGFTFLASSFSQPQIQALMAIPENRLLVETDSPYITPGGISVNSPVYLGEVVKVVARHRRTSVKEMCRRTTENAFTVFGQ